MTYVTNLTQYFDYSPPVLSLWARWMGNIVAAYDEMSINFKPMSEAASCSFEVYYKKNGISVTENHSLQIGERGRQ